MRAGEASTPSPLDDITRYVDGPGNACRAGQFIPSLSPERRDAIEAALGQIGRPGSRMTVIAIGRAIKQWGFPGQPEAAARHIAGRCACPR